MPGQLARVDDLYDVGMAELDQRADLAGEPIEELRARGGLIPRPGELQDDVGLQVAIIRQVDAAHVPLADPAEDLVTSLGDLHADPLAAVGCHGMTPHAETRPCACMSADPILLHPSGVGIS